MAETLRHRLQSVANRLLHPLGLHLSRRDRSFEMEGLLARASARGLSPSTVIDVGASDGVWSLRARHHFPKAAFLLFEPLSEHQAALQTLSQTQGFHIVPAVAGSTRGTVNFVVAEGLDGSGVAGEGASGTRPVPQEVIDHAVAERRLEGPFLIKLDTHGYELPVLDGAPEALERTELLIVEAYNFSLTPGCLRFHELCVWMETRGFRCCDLADPMRRPGDEVLWQMDLAFAPAHSRIFASSLYD